MTYSPCTNSHQNGIITKKEKIKDFMSKELVKNVAITLRKIRKQKNISQEDLASLAGLDRTYISGVERGVRNITLDSLESIVLALEINISDFLLDLNKSIQTRKEN